MLIAMFCINVISIAVCIFFSIQLYRSEKNSEKKEYVLYRIKETISDINEGATSEVYIISYCFLNILYRIKVIQINICKIR